MNSSDQKTLTVRVFATLRSLCDTETSQNFPLDATIADILIILGVPAEKVAIIFINNRHAELSSIPADGDDIAFFPPVGGG